MRNLSADFNIASLQTLLYFFVWQCFALLLLLLSRLLCGCALHCVKEEQMSDAKPDLSVVEDPVENFSRAQEATGKEAIALYEAVLNADDGAIKNKEASIVGLAGLYASLGQADKLAALLENSKPLFAQMPKARTAKIVRTLIDHVAAVPGDTLSLQEKLCVECIAWAETEKRR